MEKHKDLPLATELLNDIQNKIDGILLDIKNMDEDLERAKFVLNELLEIVMDKPKNEEEALRFANNQNRIYMFADTAFDYIGRLQSSLTDLIVKTQRELYEDADKEKEDGIND